ncbi:hypothetical protein M2281_004817 [Mesorhizobium soli]|uniref:hypothetical protein n=1 Tax=Pseudaminobacter soli (ex Li et al. 2025) TaxID=1295366 RepID=UPI0024757CDF|nr:hypothetical protein [Mesorhizobium soli]MDH6234203.1 hypothetical protein [Mesorhizobium soli]
MQIKFYPATATALALLMGAAHADSNFANVVQSGSSNSGVVTQGPGSHNKIGTEADAALQSGSNNDLNILQSGSSNEVGTARQGFDQLGNRNRANITQSADWNTVGEVQQVDQTNSGATTRNALTITQQGSGKNRVDTVRQTRTSGLNAQPGNNAMITQGDTTSEGTKTGGNHIGTLSQTGRGNSATVTQSSSDNDLGALNQKGSQNSATLLQQSGDGNKVGTIDQNGTGKKPH